MLISKRSETLAQSLWRALSPGRTAMVGLIAGSLAGSAMLSRDAHAAPPPPPPLGPPPANTTSGTGVPTNAGTKPPVPPLKPVPSPPANTTAGTGTQTAPTNQPPALPLKSVPPQPANTTAASGVQTTTTTTAKPTAPIVVSAAPPAPQTPPAAPTKPVPQIPPTAPTPPSTPTTPTAPAASALVQLGRALFFDPGLSNPTGVSCSTCHTPAAGWSYGDSGDNLAFGVAEGAVDTRFGNRKPPTISYAAFLREGPPTFVDELSAYAGGLFFDGRAASLEDQVPFPLLNPNEMNNTEAGVIAAVAGGPEASLFQQVYGANISTLNPDDALLDIVDAIVAFERSPALSPFSSKYDQWVAGKVKLSPQEMAGLQLFTGSRTGRPGGPRNAKNANCSICHTVQPSGGGSPDLFTASTFKNTGIPKNPNNPYYEQTNAAADPLGYNPLGAAYIDYGLGDFLYPQADLPSGNVGSGSNGEGDYLQINGAFKTPTVRNVDTRPDPDFVKAYGHNGFFKSLPQIVHFYNTRNLTSVPGEIIDFTKPNPYAGLKGTPIWPPPETPEPASLVNPTGSRRGLIGNLGLTAQDEANLVAFLKTLSDAPPPP